MESAHEAETLDRPEDIREAAKHARSRIDEQVQQMVALLADDFPQYLNRVFKQVFVDHPDLAVDLDDEKIADIKHELRTEGAEAVRAIAEDLQATDIWYNVPPHVDWREADLSANPTVWAMLQRVAEVARTYLRKHGFPLDAETEKALVYHPPSWFTPRGYFKSMLEAYLRSAVELAQLGQRLEELESRARRDELATRWDKL